MSTSFSKVRAVFDRMILLQGIARHASAAGACLFLVELGTVELYMSVETLAEIRNVLSRPSVRKRFPILTDGLVERFLQALLRRAILIEEVARVFTYERDPKDEPYINLAIASAAGYLVSRDADILDLAHPENAAGGILRELAPELRIVDPVSFLRAIPISSDVQ